MVMLFEAVAAAAAPANGVDDADVLYILYNSNVI